MATNLDYLNHLSDEEVVRFKENAREVDYNTRVEISQNRKNEDRLICEGDSWFDYSPGTDISDCLRTFHGYAIDKQDNHARAGDTLENMAHGASVDIYMNRMRPEFGIILEKVKNLQSRIFLFSGGGNDIAGNEFINYLNHHDTGLPSVRKEYADFMINETFRRILSYIILKVTDASPHIQIIMHGYGYTAPTGKGVCFYGPWLRPALVKKKILDEQEQRDAVFYMIRTYNEMLSSLTTQHTNFHHIDLTKDIDPDKDWANELHLKNPKFAYVASRIHEKIEQVAGGLTRAVRQSI